MTGKLVYDDECKFCTWAAAFATRRSDLEPVGMAWLTDEEKEQLPHDYTECAQLIIGDAVYSCGEATERAFVRAGVLPEDLVESLRENAAYIGLREGLYHFMSNHTDLWANVLHEEAPIGER